MKRTLSHLSLVALLTATAALSACGSASSTGTGGAVAVVASTDVWGSIVSAIGGTRVSVTSIIDDPSADPHSYEANAQNQLAISKAAVVVENGGGYDDFVGKMLSSAGSSATVVNAVDISGYAAAGTADLNEHVWYDFPTVQAVALQIESALAKADPTDAATFAANANALNLKISALIQREAAIKAKSAGGGVAVTEPVPLYLLTACGLVNRTPPGFSQAIESDSDAPPAVVAQTLALFNGKKVKALVYNEQTTGPQTAEVLAAAKVNGIPVVPVTETLPAGTDYLSWMSGNLTAVAAALG